MTTALLVQGASQVGENQSGLGVSSQAQAGSGDFGAAFSQSLAASGGSSSKSAAAKPEEGASAAKGVDGSEEKSETADGSVAPGTDVKAKIKSAAASQTVATGRATSGASRLQTNFSDSRMSQSGLRSSRLAAIEDVLPTSLAGSAAAAEETLTAVAPASSTKDIDTAIAVLGATGTKIAAEASLATKLANKELADAAIQVAGTQGATAGVSDGNVTRTASSSVEKAGPLPTKGEAQKHLSSDSDNLIAKQAGLLDLASLTLPANPAVSQATSAAVVAGAALNDESSAAPAPETSAFEGVEVRVDLNRSRSHSLQNGSENNVKSSVPAWTQGISVASLKDGQAGQVPATIAGESLASSKTNNVAATFAGLPSTLNISQVREASQPQFAVAKSAQRADATAGADSFGSAIVARADTFTTLTTKLDGVPHATSETAEQFSALAATAVAQKTSMQRIEAAAGGSLPSALRVRYAGENVQPRPGQVSLAPSTGSDTGEVSASIATPGSAATVSQEQTPASTLMATAVAPVASSGTPTRTSQTSRLNGARPSTAAARADASNIATAAGSPGDAATSTPSSSHDVLATGSASAPAVPTVAVVNGVQASGTQVATVGVAVPSTQHLAVGAAAPSREAELRGVAFAAASTVTEVQGPAHGASSATGITAQPLSATSTSLEVGVHGGGTQGWLRIRAEMDGQGEVTASLAASSPRGEELLKGQMPALNAYLHNEQMSVTTTLAERGLLSAAATAHDGSLTSLALNAGSSGHNGSAFQNNGSGNGQGLDGQAQSDRSDGWRQGSSVGDVPSDGATLRARISAEGVGTNLQVTSLDGSGRWLNVRA